jgi:hypothetical protein
MTKNGTYYLFTLCFFCWAALACIIFAWTFAALAMWGNYAYIYKSPLLGKRTAASFMGDYWGLCLNQLVPRLPEVLPDLSKEVEIPMAMNVARQQQERLQSSLFFKDPKWRSVNLVDHAVGREYYYVLVQRQPYLQLKKLEGKVELKEIYRVNMPPNGDPACIVYEAKKI